MRSRGQSDLGRNLATAVATKVNTHVALEIPEAELAADGIDHDRIEELSGVDG
jgi:hypothetical protein